MNEREDDDLIRTPLHISSSKGNVVLTLLLIWVRSNCSIYFTINKHCNRALTPLSYTILYCTVLYYFFRSLVGTQFLGIKNNKQDGGHIGVPFKRV